jgi:hypothetical protein
MPVIPALRGLRQEDHKVKTRVGYIAEILSKKEKRKKRKLLVKVFNSEPRPSPHKYKGTVTFNIRF